MELVNGDFLRIKSIWQDTQSTEVVLSGPLLRRTKHLGGLMARKLNETCWVQDVFLDGSTEPSDVPLASVLRLRQLRMTNRPFRSFNITHTNDNTTSAAIKEAEGILFCRFRFCSVYESQAQKKKEGHANFSEKFISSLEPEEIDVGWLVSQPKASRRHRNEATDEDRRNFSRSSTATLIGDNEVSKIQCRQV